MKKLPGILKNLIVLLFWLAVWHLLALAVAKPLLLPAPLAVIGRVGELMLTGSFWKITAVSLGRILLGLICAVVLGVVLAVATSRFKLLRSIFAPLITAIKSTPVVSFILLVLIWVGRNILPSIIVVLMALPVVWSNLMAGIEETDPLLLQMAKLYRFGTWKTLRRVYVPSVMPHFLSACRSCLGLAWKSGVAAEVLTVPALSIGKMLYESKLYWETLDLFAWTLVVIICSLIIEKILMSAISRMGRSYGGGKI